jgi:predicted SAM-dependent methyltransferase
MKLNIGSGQKHLKDYINIDLLHGQEKIDASDILTHHPEWENQVDEIIGMHIFEHFDYDQWRRAIPQFYKLLKPEAKLVLELPNIKDVFREYIKDPYNLLVSKYIWGGQDSEGQYHYWGWCPETLSKLLTDNGFKVELKEATDYHKNEMPCFRIEGTK